MKNFFSLLFTLFCFVGIANARWTDPFYSKGDELTGLSAAWMYIYSVHDGYVGFVDELNNKDSDWICFTTSESIFDYDFDYDNLYVNCIIGFYSNNKLIEKIITEAKVFSDIGDAVGISDFSIVEKNYQAFDYSRRCKIRNTKIWRKRF